MSNELKYSPNIDVRVNNLADIMPEGLLKVYPYRLINHNKDKAFLKPNTVTIAQISQLPYISNDGDTVFHNMQMDESGNLYFELLAASTITGQLDVSIATSTMAKTIKYEKTFIGLTNQFFDHASEQPVFFTIGEPYNYEKYVNDELAVYAAAEIIPSETSQIAGIEQTGASLDDETLTEISFARVEVLEAQYVNTKIVFRNESHIDFSKISIELENTSLLNRITAIGSVDGSEGDIDFKIDGRLTPFKGTAVSTNENTTLFYDWFDQDAVMPMFIANKFASSTGATLADLKTMKIAGSTFFSDREVNLLTDMLSVSYAFATSYSIFNRITDPSKADYGKIDPKQTIGSTDIKITSIDGKDPRQVIDGIFETYLRQYPQDEDSYTLRIIKTIINALSRYIYSSYAIGKGQNSFNQVYLPWFLTPINKISLVSSKKTVDGVEVDSWNVPSLLSFGLKSRYFRISSGVINLPSDIDISSVKMIQTDRKLTIPYAGTVIQEQDKIPLPGDISTVTSQDLQYLWYAPIDTELLAKKLYLDEPTSTIEGGERTVEWDTLFGKPGQILPTQTSDIIAFIKNDYSKRTNIPLSAITVEASGIGQLQTSTTDDITQPETTIEQEYKDNSYNYTGWAKIVHDICGDNFPNNLPNNEKGYTMTNAETVKALSILLKIPENTIEAVTVGGQKVTTSPGWVGNTYTALPVKYRVRIQRFSGATVKTTGKQTVVDFNRATLFNKSSWRQMVKNAIGITTKTISLKELNGGNIDYIDEITISSMWANKIGITFGSPDTYTSIDSFNKDDETIVKQRILFY